MRVAIEAASLSLSSGGLARYTSELALALARCFPEDEYYLVSDQPFRMPAPAPANLKAGGGPRNSMERRWWLWGLTREIGTPGRRPRARSRFRRALFPAAPQRAHPARSLAVDGLALAPRRAARPPPHPSAAGVRPRHHGDHPRRAGAPRRHRALRPGSRACGGGARSRRPLVPAGGDPARRALLPLRRHPGTAQESGHSSAGLARGAPHVPGRAGAGRAPPRRCSPDRSRARPAPRRRSGR